MRDLHDCIDNLVLEDQLSREEAAQLHEAHRRNSSGQGGFGFDEAAAGRATFDEFEAELMQRRRQKLLGVQAQLRAVYDLRGYRDELGRASPTKGARAILDSAAFGAKYRGVAQLHEAIRGRLHATLGDAFAKFERDILGNTRNQATLVEVVDALFGSTNVSPAARQIAQAWRIAAERARLMFNKAGGNIGFREDWGLPQGHDWERVAEAGFDQWRDFITPLLDRPRMIDGHTGKPFTDFRLEMVLRDTWEAIATEGASRREASSLAVGKSIGNRRADPRFLVLKDGAAWRGYMERFGEGDAFKVMMDYIDGMSRDIALMQRLGPNPAAGVEFIRQTLQRDADLSLSPKEKEKARVAGDDIKAMYEIFTGQASIPSIKLVASIAGEARQWLVSAQLGSAILSAVSDLGFQGITARMNGLPQWKILARQLALLRPDKAADRELAISLGLIADEASQALSAQQRHFGEAWGSGLSQRFADGVLRVSGLSAWTQAGRWAFGMEFLGMLGRASDTAFDRLHPKVQATLQRYGFDAGQWDEIRRGTIEKRGARWLDPARIADEALGLRVQAMIRGETHFAVPSVSLYGRSLLQGAARPGTIAGEFNRSFLMYKNFGITLLFTHGRRMAMQTTWGGKIGYGGAMIASATALGALSMQMKEIAKGRDPQPMGSLEFGLAALAQGGGFGIFGDFLFSGTNRFGGGWQETVAGPVVGAAADVWGLLNKVGAAAMGDDKANPGGELVRMLERYTPGGSLWYARAAYQRMILDQLGEMLDPNFSDRVRQIERRAKEKGQQFWWRPGQPLPRRAPDVDNAFAAPPS